VAAGFECEAVDPPLEEPANLACGLRPAQQAEALAYYQARKVAESWPSTRVLAVRTLVVQGGSVFGRPAGAIQPERTPRAVSDTRHAVVTGVAMVVPGRRLIASSTTFVTMRRLPEAVIQRYLASGEWLGEAGPDGGPDIYERFVAGLEGSFSNLLGVPVALVDQMMAELSHQHGDGVPAMVGTDQPGEAPGGCIHLHQHTSLAEAGGRECLRR
jgi:septum formation protein